MTWVVSPNHGIVDNLEILTERLKAKQAKDGTLKADILMYIRMMGGRGNWVHLWRFLRKRCSWKNLGTLIKKKLSGVK